ncbi:hypothetical protein CEQ90_10060 [Lewinellaceae bacterium SD302]|nr:hypothetical protein CEQ90_10060 [Lewinellaceae bacterium SD302]
MPEDSISGVWVGSLYQQEGGIADEFYFLLEINQQGLYAEGISRVGLEDIQAAITFVATRELAGHWAFTEREITSSRAPDNLEWCYKQYHLKLKYASDGSMILTGPWWGRSKSGACIPGTIILKKSKTRA